MILLILVLAILVSDLASLGVEEEGAHNNPRAMAMEMLGKNARLKMKVKSGIRTCFP